MKPEERQIFFFLINDQFKSPVQFSRKLELSLLMLIYMDSLMHLVSIALFRSGPLLPLFEGFGD